MKPLPQTRSVANRPVPPIKLARLRLRTFRPDSSTYRSGWSKTGHMDCLVFITIRRVDALPDWEGGLA
ncbi:hypothetical protein [Roseibium alexandrii]|uniref:hypothetical protein n=1 Tax=Roseibium alexandrii TaxID=388408 RepID=UPI003752FFD5